MHFQIEWTPEFSPGVLQLRVLQQRKGAIDQQDRISRPKAGREPALQEAYRGGRHEAGVCATLSANGGKRTAEATIIVDPEKEEKEELLSEGLVFRPQNLTVCMNRVRKAVLRVYVKIIEGGSRVSLTSDNENVHVSPESIVVNEADATARGRV